VKTKIKSAAQIVADRQHARFVIANDSRWIVVAS
jgi:hypothetical protein